MQKPLFYTLLFCLITACTVDYDLKQTNIDEPNRLVVNSFLNPENPINIYFYTIDRTDTGFVYHTAENLHVRLTEDDRVLFDGLCADTMLVMEHHPRVGSTYRIDVSLAGYASVWAEKTVPTAITCKIRAEQFSEPDTNDYSWSYSSYEMKYFLSDFAGNYEQENTSLFVLAYSVLNGDSLVKSYELFASNVLLDVINRSNASQLKDEDVGSSYYEEYMRIKNRNIPYLDNLIFITRMHGDGYYDYTDFQEPFWTPPTWIPVDVTNYIVKLITAGPEFDMFHRTFYEQTLYIRYDDFVANMLYQPIQVYSNINGGLGIFAGMNETNYYFDVPEQAAHP